MNTIPTAEEFLMASEAYFNQHNTPQNLNAELLRKFTKLHVKAALKAAAHRSECYNKAKFPGDENWVVDIESILNAYPLENIK